MYDARTNLSPEVVEAVKNIVKRIKNKSRLLCYYTKKCTLREKHQVMACLFIYMTQKSKGSESYELLAQQVLEREVKVVWHL